MQKNTENANSKMLRTKNGRSMLLSKCGLLVLIITLLQLMIY